MNTTELPAIVPAGTLAAPGELGVWDELTAYGCEVVRCAVGGGSRRLPAVPVGRLPGIEFAGNSHAEFHHPGYISRRGGARAPCPTRVSCHHPGPGDRRDAMATNTVPDDPPETAVTRRDALKLAGLGIGSAAAFGVGVGGVRAVTNGAFSAGSGDPYDLWHEWSSMSGVERVVAAGVLACNPHNTQPWRMSVNGNVIDVHSDPSRRMPLNDASGREHFAGLGCAVENMVIAAGSAALTAQVTLFPDGVASDLVARIALSGGGRGRDRDLAAAIPHRHTNRGPYTSRPVDLSGFTEQSSRVDGASVLWITDGTARQRLGRLYVEATEAITADSAQSTEAFTWFRSSRSTIDKHRDGLTLDGQGLSRLTLFAAKLLPAQSRKDGDAYWVKATREVHTATAAAYGVITVDDVTDRTAQVNGGRLLARMHLTATALGLGLHHMNQITERIDRDAASGNPDVFSARWAALLGRPASSGLLSFRIGHPERTPGLSPRRSLDDVVTR
ncbi:Acg family FMN-binding oxidoreductase [Streptomyces sp. NPDC088254]|uniref:Acg family FMN-binding oxidoreductase n=1 Tax=Streptomyces sp. NPDC088254 TaxID=3365847 RepID=UPI0038017CDC